MGDDGFRRKRIKGKAGGEVFTAGFDPFVEHFGLEQRSREILEEESRIGFARPEPLAEDREGEVVAQAGAGAGERRSGFLAERRASRNLLLHERSRRDVLN